MGCLDGKVVVITGSGGGIGAACAQRFAAEGDTLRAVRKAKSGPVDGVTYRDDNPKCATGQFDVIAGTAWLFASKAMREHPVDVLVVDEAGQLGLADTLAASASATNAARAPISTGSAPRCAPWGSGSPSSR